MAVNYKPQEQFPHSSCESVGRASSCYPFVSAARASNKVALASATDVAVARRSRGNLVEGSPGSGCGELAAGRVERRVEIRPLARKAAPRTSEDLGFC